ncbi:hemagglutinin repeat-containing protein [Pseudomonas baetica]|uniref:two-partner secretion domain-containing protein n=1 Tax=Pseudomonas baetica TaxID=674054 RepID=UPI003EEA9A9A
MDARHYAFLACQPSAVLKTRDRFCGMPKRGLALLLANVMFWQPIWAQADGIVVANPGTGLDHAGNGVPIVNIATPNGSGLSHNQFVDYNVGSQGVVLNNVANQTGATQLGGIIIGNPHLKNSGSAQTILNEVVGGSPSQLRGYTEVAGQSARVIVANPYGISCNGCGFINTPRVTLTTGRPVLDGSGRLDRFQVDQGSVSIDGAGLNANNVDSFEVITRSAKINAEIQANNLSIVTGRNDVNAQTLNATARADDGSAKPQLAIDSSALGGMYAGAIKLVGTEVGVGVHLAGNLAASAGDIQLDANGHLSLAQTAASGAVNVKAVSFDSQGSVYAGSSLNVQTTGDLNAQQNLAARDNVSLTVGGRLNNNGVIEAGVNADNGRNTTGDVSLTAQSMINRGSVVAGRSLQAQVSQSLDNQGATLSGQQAVQLAAGTLDNRNKGRVLGNGSQALTADQLLNNQNGLISSNGALTVNVRYLNNSGGRIASKADLTASIGQLIQQGGDLVAQGNLTLKGTSLDNSGGNIVAQQGLDIRLDHLLINVAGLLSSEGTLSVNAEALDNSSGSLSSADTLTLSLTGALTNKGGTVATDKGLILTSGSLDNHQQGLLTGKGAVSVTTQSFDNSQGGQLISGNSLDLSAAQVNNANGTLASEKALNASVTGLDQQGGQLFSHTSLSLDLNNGQLNNQYGLINGPLLMLKHLNGLNNQHGEISSAQAFTLTAQALDNSSGKLISNQALTLRIAQVLSNVAGLVSAASLDAHSASLDNDQGLLSSLGDLSLTVDGNASNQAGSVIASGNLLLNAANFDNNNGQVSAKNDLRAQVTRLTNRNGLLIAQGGLTLAGLALDNRLNGLVGSTGTLQLNVDGIDNRGGELSSNADLNLTASSLDNSDSGLAIAGQSLNLTVDRLLNRTLGQLSGNSGLSLIGSSLDNSHGSLRSQENLSIHLSGDLTNSAGLLNSEGLLSVSAASLANRLGSLSSAGQLSLTILADVDNQGGQLVTDGGIDLHSASFDNSQQGSLSGKLAVQISTGALDNSQGGLVTGADTLDLTATQVTNQSGGRIAAAKALTASVTGLDQQGGQLFSNTALTLNLNHGQLNNQGGLINAPLLMLNNLSEVNNQTGEISSTQGFTLAANHLDNSNGRLLSNQGLTLRIAQALSNINGLIAAAAIDAHSASLDNSGGTLTSRANLDLNVDGTLSNQNQGLINAAQTLSINSATLNNQNGSLLGNSIGLDFGAATGDLNNSGGLITTQGSLGINHLRDLTNQNGEISSSQSFTLTGRSLDNSAGKLISSNLLTLNAIGLLNQGGLISGWQGLNVSASSLDNRNSGTLSSRNGDLDVSLSGALQNGNNGALVSQQALSVSAASLDNTAGILSSGGAQTLTVGGLLNNAQAGLIDSGATLTLQTMTLSNVSGTINAQQALTFTGTGLDNTSGNLTGNGTVTLDLLGALTNTHGKLASAGSLLIQRSSQVNNQGGQLASQSLLTLLTGRLDNSQLGTLAASGQLSVTASGAVLNGNNGLIYSQNDGLQLQAASLDNGQGTLQSQKALGVQTTGDISNQSGHILAQSGNLSVTGANLDNRGGVLASLQGAFTAHLTGVLKNGYDSSHNNQGGITQAQSLSLSVLGGIDNYGGRIAAQAGNAVLVTGNVDNRNGGIYANGLVSVTGNNFDNSGSNDGQIAGHQITLNLGGALNNRQGVIESDSTLAISAASLDNQTGRLRALGTNGKTQFQIGGLFDNRSGTLEAANIDLALGAASFLNSGGSLLHVGTGSFDISTANVTGAGGNIVTRGGLTLSADSLTNSSVIQAGRLTVNVNTLGQTAGGQLLASSTLVGNGGNWSNDGLIASDGTLSIGLSGYYSGNGRMSSLGTLGLSADRVDLSNVASIAGGGNTTVSSSLLNNYGRLTSNASLSVVAGTLNNYGTLGSAQKLTASASALLNSGGLIFSGGDMALWANTFTNRYADVYSLGNLAIGGDASGGWSASIANVSATIESAGDLSLAASHIENRKDVFQTTGGLLSGYIGVQCYSCSSFDDFDNRADSYAVWVENYQSQIVQDSASASMTAGGNFTANGGDFLNQASTLSAASNLTFNLQTFTNQGAAVGDYSVRRSIALTSKQQHTDLAYWFAIMDYNAANDPEYDPGAAGYLPDGMFVGPNIHVWDSAGNESLLGVGVRGGTRESQGYGRFGSVWIEYDGGVWQSFTLPHYSDSVRTQAPAVIQNATPFDTTIVYNSPSSYANAVVQAGGAVSINATQSLTNSVVRQGVGIAAGGSRVGATQSSGSNQPTIVNLNPQLPPDLAHQRVNPLTLPGFSLPTGQNGLFRLSGQGSSTTQDSAPQTWTMGGNSISLAQREQSVPLTQGRILQVADVVQIGVSTVTLGLEARQGGSLDPSASTAVQGPSVAQPGTTTQVAGQMVARVQGLPGTRSPANTHKYLIETNPVLTDLKQFMSSDYLLAGLGYNPDDSARRLGDGFYEQRLIQQAVVARTGQAFIDGQTSNEDLFKYLMDNAIASKNALNLTVGVSLTAEQVAALTHDIVWMESVVVDGQTVLVPVLYLAQADNRLGPTGALIEGRDVSLIAGQDLNNTGTLRASSNLSAVAGNDLINSGLIQAGDRLDLLAGNNLTNQAGGIIAGRDVSLTAINGDVLNERTVSTFNSSTGGYSQQRDVVDNAARIEAANNLSISAGREINNTGGVLQSGADITLNAGRDINLIAAQALNSTRFGSNNHSESIRQYGGSVDAGRDLSLSAGRDITVIASQIDARRNIAMAATENLTLASAADEQHSYSKSKKVEEQEDHIHQVGTSVTAGGSVVLSAGQDLTLISSKVSAGDEAYLVAGGNLELLAAQDSDYSLYDMKKKGSFGSKKTQRDEVTDVKNIGSEIKTGGDLTLVSGGDQRYQGARLNSGGDLTLDSGGSITFEAVKDLHRESHEKSSSNLAWQSAKGKGTTDETLRQSELTANGQIVIKAVNGLKIDLKNIDQKTVSQTIDAMVQADPKLAWLKDAEQRGDVDWQLVKELHDSWDYESSGLGAAPALIIAIVASYFLGPIFGPMASNIVVGTINGGGDVGEGFQATFSSDSLKGYVIAGVSGGIGGDNIGLHLAINSALKTVLQGGKFKDNLTQAAVMMAADALSGYLYQNVGNALNGSGLATKVAVHAIVGGLIGEAAGGDFRTAALAAGANEALLELVGKDIFPGDAHARLIAMVSQLVGITVAAVAGGSPKDQEVAGWVTQQAAVNNYLQHEEVDSLAQELVGCRTNSDPVACRGQVQDKYQALNDSKTGSGLYGCKGEGEKACSGQYTDAKDGSAKLDSLLDSFALNADEKAVLAHFQDINHNDERVADHAWLQSFWSESGVAGGVLSGGAAALAAAERAAAAKAAAEAGAKATGSIDKLPPLRQAYVDEVNGLSEISLSMRAAGATPEQVARQLHQIRRELGVQYKDLTPPDKLAEIYERNLRVYGDKLGPSIDWLRAKGKSWEQITESASRSGGKDLGFKYD